MDDKPLKTQLFVLHLQESLTCNGADTITSCLGGSPGTSLRIGTGSTDATFAGTDAWTWSVLIPRESTISLPPSCVKVSWKAIIHIASSTKVFRFSRMRGWHDNFSIILDNVSSIWTSGRKCNFKGKGCDAEHLQPININGWFWAGAGNTRIPKTDVRNGGESHWSSTGE